MSLGEGIVKFLRISRYYPDIIRYPGYPQIGLLSARPDRIIYPLQVWLMFLIACTGHISKDDIGARDKRKINEKRRGAIEII